jgi:hypothetical protein
MDRMLAIIANRQSIDGVYALQDLQNAIESHGALCLKMKPDTGTLIANHSVIQGRSNGSAYQLKELSLLR